MSSLSLHHSPHPFNTQQSITIWFISCCCPSLFVCIVSFPSYCFSSILILRNYFPFIFMTLHCILTLPYQDIIPPYACTLHSHFQQENELFKHLCFRSNPLYVCNERLLYIICIYWKEYGLTKTYKMTTKAADKICLNDILSWTTGPNSTSFHWNVSHSAIYQNCTNVFTPLHKMVSKL